MATVLNIVLSTSPQWRRRGKVIRRRGKVIRGIGKVIRGRGKVTRGRGKGRVAKDSEG